MAIKIASQPAKRRQVQALLLPFSKRCLQCANVQYVQQQSGSSKLKLNGQIKLELIGSGNSGTQYDPRLQLVSNWTVGKQLVGVELSVCLSNTAKHSQCCFSLDFLFHLSPSLHPSFSLSANDAKYNSFIIIP